MVSKARNATTATIPSNIRTMMLSLCSPINAITIIRKLHASGLLASLLRFPLTPQQLGQRLQQSSKILRNVSRSFIMMRLAFVLMRIIAAPECKSKWGHRYDEQLVVTRYTSRQYG
ncbi:hypothetical protein TNIN_427051 [Trichonephila inaurata madagascariensis]|uniref:Uncharacterized protein n=1 Tax=Trichonephila inaurata madagascariensis TaxID=2747483 RepID=A0A8X7CCL6_9ARAC|nr:hypothetical protein TNIN_427051 [Trichonephila inaurata madagascariensis]